MLPMWNGRKLTNFSNCHRRHDLSLDAQPVGGVAVTITTQDATGIKLELRGKLWQPSEPAKGAVVLARVGRMSAALSAE